MIQSDSVGERMHRTGVVPMAQRCGGTPCLYTVDHEHHEQIA